MVDTYDQETLQARKADTIDDPTSILRSCFLNLKKSAQAKGVVSGVDETDLAAKILATLALRTADWIAGDLASIAVRFDLWRVVVGGDNKKVKQGVSRTL